MRDLGQIVCLSNIGHPVLFLGIKYAIENKIEMHFLTWDTKIALFGHFKPTKCGLVEFGISDDF